jgi:hypothetical protein
MKHTPGPDTEKSLTDRIAFFQSGAEHYAKYGERVMVEWSLQMAKQAQEQLALLKGKREPGDGE